MWIIDLTPLAPGVYNDHRSNHITAPPEGWAMIPDDFPIPSTFPRLGSIEAEEMTYTREAEVMKPVEVPVLDEDGNPVLDEEGNPVTKTKEQPVKEPVRYTMMTVTAMTEGTLPEPVPEHVTGDRVIVQIDMGTMPLPGTTKSVAHGIESFGKLLSLRGTATDGTAYLALPCEGASLYISGEYVCIACSADLSSYTDVTVQIEYEVG